MMQERMDVSPNDALQLKKPPLDKGALGFIYEGFRIKCGMTHVGAWHAKPLLINSYCTRLILRRTCNRILML